MIELNRYEVNRDEFENIEEDELALFFNIGHISNELNTLNKMFMFSVEKNDPAEPIHAASITNTMLLTRLISGKLNESYNFLKDNFQTKKFSKDYYQIFDDELKAMLKDTNKYFNKKSCLIRKVRNLQSFHYDKKHMLSLLRHSNDSLFFYLHNSFGNTLYYHSEVLKVLELVSILDESGSKKVIWSDHFITDTFGEFINDINIYVSNFLNIFNGIMAVFIDRYPEAIIDDDNKVLLINSDKGSDDDLFWYVDLKDKK